MPDPTGTPVRDTFTGDGLDPASLLGTWYDAECWPTTFTFMEDGTFKVDGGDFFAFNHSNTYHFMDAHHVEIDGLQYEASLLPYGRLSLFDFPVAVTLSRSPCPPTPVVTYMPIPTPVEPFDIPLPLPTPVSTSVP